MYFFTVVTHNRREFLTHELSRKCLRCAWNKIAELRPFKVVAICLLPNHIHCIWELPEGDADYPRRWAGIKGLFTRYFLASGGKDGWRDPARRKHREAAIWQKRYWEHRIRDADDFNNHINYIHYNPVKHELVKNVEDWPWSTYRRFACKGYYGRKPLQEPEDFYCAGE